MYVTHRVLSQTPPLSPPCPCGEDLGTSEAALTTLPEPALYPGLILNLLAPIFNPELGMEGSVLASLMSA